MNAGRALLGALLVSLAGLPARAQEAPIDLAEARRAFDAAGTASDLDGGALWGIDLYGPLKERLAREADLRARFVDGPVVRLVPGAEFSFSFDPNDAVNLEDAGTVYGSTPVTDVWGILEVDSGGALFLRNAEGWFTGVVVPAPAGGSGPPTSSDGWRLDLADGWEITPGDWVVRERSARS